MNNKDAHQLIAHFCGANTVNNEVEIPEMDLASMIKEIEKQNGFFSEDEYIAEDQIQARLYGDTVILEYREVKRGILISYSRPANSGFDTLIDPVILSQDTRFEIRKDVIEQLRNKGIVCHDNNVPNVVNELKTIIKLWDSIN